MLFVGVGALLGAHQGRGGPRFVPYARPFMHWAAHRPYQVAWLNPGALRNSFRLSSALGLPDDAVSVAGYRTYRHEALTRLQVPWAWVDAGLAPAEMAWVKANAPERYIPVASGTGVTPAHRAAVLAVLG
jgi:hypothetical protein